MSYPEYVQGELMLIDGQRYLAESSDTDASNSRLKHIRSKKYSSQKRLGADSMSSVQIRLARAFKRLKSQQGKSMQAVIKKSKTLKNPRIHLKVNQSATTLKLTHTNHSAQSRLDQRPISAIESINAEL